MSSSRCCVCGRSPSNLQLEAEYLLLPWNLKLVHLVLQECQSQLVPVSCLHRQMMMGCKVDFGCQLPRLSKTLSQKLNRGFQLRLLHPDRVLNLLGLHNQQVSGGAGALQSTLHLTYCISCHHLDVQSD